MLATYFEGLHENTSLAASLPVCALHLDLVRAPQQIDDVLKAIPPKMSLSLGVVDGRNIWKNDYSRSLALIEKAKAVIGEDRIMLAPSCSLLHSPVDLDGETNIDAEIKNWMAFAKQKLDEVCALKANSNR